MKAICVIGIAAACLAGGCDVAVRSLVTPSRTVQGSGKAATVERAVGEFTEVEVSGGIRATVDIGLEAGVLVRGDDNIVPLVRVEVAGGRLTVSPEPGTDLREVTPLEVVISAPSVTSLRAGGASNATVAGVEADRLSVEAAGASSVSVMVLDASELELAAQGASKIVASGLARAATIRASGASEILADELRLDTARVELSGASSGRIRAAEAVEGDLSGASNLRVHGEPAGRSIETSGASGVTFPPPGG